MLHRRVYQCIRRHSDKDKNWTLKVQIRHLPGKINQEELSSPIHPTVMRKESAKNVEDHNDKEEESDSEKDTEESETSESDEINIIDTQINNIDIIYEVLDVNSSLPQVGTSETNLKNVQDAKLYRTKPAKGMGYTAVKLSISIVMVVNQEVKVNKDTGEYCTCVGESYSKQLFHIGKKNLYQYKVSSLVVQVKS
ncbi:hypothetical protein O181_059785 [Austropuccinia psidii MF-1]|uniref:Uncharacterized protein n=1 Tax=Austropuccinia psidii MF-1 TaxID=1389203 RepID=A0A9Q3EJ42_9BASI|nr:hypothetical protein [Austropuccinia psidii MF-1]